MARIIDSTHKNLIDGNLHRIRKEKNLSQQQLSDKLEPLAMLNDAPFLAGHST